MNTTKNASRGLVLIALFTVTGCGQFTDYSVEEWWQRVIQVDASNFADIKHFTLQGIDYSHHFRFKFKNRSDLDEIIRKHKLTADARPIQFLSNNIPSWFVPPENANAYSNGNSDPSIVFWIDDDSQVAYLELVEI